MARKAIIIMLIAAHFQKIYIVLQVLIFHQGTLAEEVTLFFLLYMEILILREIIFRC